MVSSRVSSRPLTKLHTVMPVLTLSLPSFQERTIPFSPVGSRVGKETEAICTPVPVTLPRVT